MGAGASSTPAAVAKAVSSASDAELQAAAAALGEAERSKVLEAIGNLEDPRWNDVRDQARAGFGWDVVWRFRDEHTFLSNMYSAKYLAIEMDGMTFPSSEHCFMAAKTLSRAERQSISEMPDPKDAKNFGRGLQLREDWEDVKKDVMHAVLRRKFAHPQLAGYLLATGQKPLVEGNLWHDTTWGMAIVDGELQGSNMLGELLMLIREEIREGSLENSPRAEEIELLRCQA